MIRLVVNADDLGLNPRIDEGILQAHRDGIATSATVLVTGSSAGEAVRRAQQQGLALGVHLCLTSRLPPAAPTAEVSTVAPGGRFRPTWLHVTTARALGKLSLDEVEHELEAQVARAQVLGFSPDHLDSHQHLHLLPGITERVVRIAQRHRLPLRWLQSSVELRWLRHVPAGAKTLLLSGLARRTLQAEALPMVGLFESGHLDRRALIRCLNALPDGDFELGCHPGLNPAAVPEQPGWHYGWEQELAALCSPAAREIVSARNIRLCTYAEMFSVSRSREMGDRTA